MVKRDRLIKLTQKLIEINSENPPGDESKIAVFVSHYLKEIGLSVKVQEFSKKRSNVLAYLRSDGERKSLLITPHLDTVPAGRNWKCDPFVGEVRDGKIYGLGSTDCKGNLACAIEAIHSIVEEKKALAYNLILAATADEESGSGLGLIPLLEKKILTPDAALVLDSDDFEIIVTQKGLMHLRVRVFGKKAHGAYPHLGVNAIDIAVNVIKEIKKYKFKTKRNKYLRPLTVNVGTIKGGDKVNVVADWCEFELDFRFLPGDSSKEILTILRSILKRYAKRFEIEIEGIQKPYIISENHPLVENLKEAMRSFGVRAKLNGSEGATVITFFQDSNIPAIASGFGSAGCAHICDEYAKIDHLFKGTLILEKFLKNYTF
jgi:succinyl-diaminopimelate desuccinylase